MTLATINRFELSPSFLFAYDVELRRQPSTDEVLEAVGVAFNEPDIRRAIIPRHGVAHRMIVIVACAMLYELVGKSFPEISDVCCSSGHTTEVSRHKHWMKLPAWLRSAIREQIEYLILKARERKMEAA